MVCYVCQTDTQVINSRLQKRSNQVWRRRRCTLCDVVFTTVEAIDYAKVLSVIGSSRKPEPFNRDRLFMSLYKTLGHRPSALADAGDLAATIIAKLTRVQNTQLRTEQISQIALVALNRFDKLAAQLYVATHK